MPIEPDHPPICITCGYNLTGLTSEKCPECGWKVDWELACADDEARRPGTPAHRAKGWRTIDQTLVTVLQMLLTPWRFARVLRRDEHIGPALAVALLSYAATFSPVSSSGPSLKDAMRFAPAVLTVILLQSLVFATADRKRTFRAHQWPMRFRMWMLVSLYSTCFVATWRIADPPIADLWQPNFYVPWASNARNTFVPSATIGTSVNFYWWWLILAVVLCVRNRPRWLAFACIPLVYLFAFAGQLAYQLTGHFVESKWVLLR